MTCTHAWLLFLPVAFAAAMPAAADWTCSNPVEIACIDGTCGVADGFTPFAVTAAEDGGLTICAYTGCAKDPSPLWFASSGFEVHVADALTPDSGTGALEGGAILSVRIADGLGTLVVETYAMPVFCTVTETLED